MSCTDKNPLFREGTSQLNRLLAALDVHYADVDERTAADLILFAKQYAAYLQFYNESNTPDGTWQPFMMMDISVTLATLSGINVQQISNYKKLLYKNIMLSANLPSPGGDNKAKQQFRYLFDMMFSLVKIIDEQLKLLPDEDYKTTVQNIITAKLKLNVANLQQRFFEDYKTLGLLDYSAPDLDSNAHFETVSNEHFTIADLSAAWQPAAPDLNITIPPLANDYEKIIYIINHNLFNNTIEAILKGAALIAAKAKEEFDKTIVDFPQHAPHYALFLAFVKLVKTAQDDLNLYTKHHLDFYFKDILRLQNKAPQPDSVHLTFELKAAVQQLLAKDTLFKGGKDITGKEINYRLTDNVLITNATVTGIQAQQIDIENKTPLKTFPIANSEDGEGAKLVSADKSWAAFGNPDIEKTAKAGFAIASNILFLNEGERDITLTITFESSVPELKLTSSKNLYCFEATLTGKKDWLKKNVYAVYDDVNRNLVFTITLSPNDPPIIPYTEKIHKQNFETGLPLLQVYLKQASADAIPYSVLCKQKIVQLTIQVNVAGVKDLALSSNAGVIDASKPFKPFGDFPDTNSAFYIGSKEILQKKISLLAFNFSGANPFATSTCYLDEANWKPLASLSGKKITGIVAEPAAIDFTPNENLKATTLNGFIRLTNTIDKSIDTYLQGIKTALDGTKLQLVDASDPLHYQLTTGKIPAPGEVIISNFSIDYTASSSISFTAPQAERKNNLFYHLSPFGYAEVFNDGTTANADAEKTETYTLLSDIINNGELFIGLNNAEPDSVVTILFQVAEGSSNPLKDKENICWFYLSNNTWIAFDSKDVVDRTDDFTQSGVVTISLPPDISNRNKLFQKNVYWVKAAVKKDVDAVCRIILIQAQAARAELVQNDAGGIEFRKIIPANSITKLVNSNPAIKTIAQPFDGFGGRTRENDEHFYVRVSERLRHKQRAISIWDYEHILLEQFPQLYKIKCLNHSGFYSKNGTDVFCENFPGHITIVPLPDISSHTNVNVLKPYTPKNLLNSIGNYLAIIISPFIKLHVKNPQFEEVRLEFNVSFYEGCNESYYQQLLNDEIEKFLTPWAYGNSADISFGSKITKSVLLNFVEERPYVDFLTCFKMHHLLRDGETIVFEKPDAEEAVATTSRSVLVSYYDEISGDKHIINTPATCNC